MATRKKTVKTVENEAVNEVSETVTENVAVQDTESVDTEAVTTTAKTVTTTTTVKKTFAQDDLIPCKSVTEGKHFYVSKKTGTKYTFLGYGDVQEIMYQDLYSLLVSKSYHLFAPKFIIEDEDVLNDTRWKSLKEFYDSLYTKDDVRDVLNLSPAAFERTIKKLPKGFLDVLKVSIASGIEDGTFDSIKKVEIMDRVCGTDFKTMIS